MSASASESALETLLAMEFPGELGPTIAATLYLALYLDPVRPEEVRDFLARSRQALGASLRFYLTGTMKDPAPINDTKIGQWLDRKLNASARRDIPTLQFNELGDEGVSPSRIRITVESLRIEPLSDSQLRRDEELRYAKLHGGTRLTAGALLLVGFPLDHPLSNPDAFIGWLQELEATRGGRLVCGSAGVALNLALQVHGQEAVEQQDLAKGLLARHPGLDQIPIFGQRVMYMTPGGDVHPRIRRAAWLNLLSDATVEELGGISTLQAALAGTPARVKRIGAHAWLVQASPAPRIGDVSTGDRVPEYAAVGRMLKPVRTEELGVEVLSYTLEWRDRWHRALDGDLPA